MGDPLGAGSAFGRGFVDVVVVEIDLLKTGEAD